MISFTVALCCALCLEETGGQKDGSASLVRWILPVSDSSVPAELVVGLFRPVSEFLLADKACVGSISLNKWLSNDNFLERNSSGSDLLD